ncbi:hypothetical protein A176_005596 [Myxococcus hansupus]|uniref:Uncharacterized protein n=1 Tax=Pseudomyxococcus hansupus TaxID=1297742 RepID=A0A0H4X0Q6_9BACT|nr:hypothetical protein A176_005596 [Myxococcus hansupus]
MLRPGGDDSDLGFGSNGRHAALLARHLPWRLPEFPSPTSRITPGGKDKPRAPLGGPAA